MNSKAPERDRWVIAALLALSVVQSFAVLVPAWAVKHLFDQALGKGGGTAKAMDPLLAFVGATLLVVAIEVVKRRVAVERAIRHASDLRSALFRKRLDGQGPAPSKGNLLLPFVGDLTAARRWQAEGLPRLVSAAVLLPAIIGMIAWQSLPMAIAMAGALGFSMALATMLLRPLEAAVREVRTTRGSLTSYLTGRLLAADVVRSSGRVGQEMGKVARRTDRLADAERKRAWAVGATRGAARMTSGLLLLAALYAGLGEVGRGHLTAGAVVGTLTLVALLGQGVTDLARALELWKPAKVSYERIAAIVGRSPRRSRAGKIAGPVVGLYIDRLDAGGGLRVEGLAVAPGTVVLVDGANRAGKSALLESVALPGSRPAAVTIDGAVIARMSERSRAKAIGYASNRMMVLPGSLGQNLDYRGTGISSDELRTQARVCGLGSLIDRLTGGLSGRIREDDELSASERAGIALVRAMAGDPPLLLIDAIDAELDADLLERVGKHLRQRKGVTLIVAHKAEWRSLATVIWRIGDDGLTVADLSKSGKILSIDRDLR